MTKSELIKASDIDATKLYPLPQTFMTKCYDAGIDPLTLFAGWIRGDNDSKIHGRPLPMSELWSMAYTTVMRPTLVFAKKILNAAVKDCLKCNGTGEIASNTFDEPPETCNKCAPLYMAILDCEKGIGQ